VSAPGRLFAFAALVALGTAIGYAAECGTRKGTPVTLASDLADPDVFVWDSRERLVAYVGGHWSSSREVMAHTVIADRGTRAQVTDCVPGIAHVKIADVERDAIGIKIMSGPLSGRYGWVVSSDVHLTKAAIR
jgi:hypothetical protein